MSVSKSRKTLFIEAVESLNLPNPVTEIAERTPYAKGNVSEFLNVENKKEPSRPFLIKFCKAFDLDYSSIFKEGQGIETRTATAALQEDIVRELLEVSKSQRELAIEIGLKAVDRAVEKLATKFATKKEVQASFDEIAERLAQGGALMQAMREYSFSRFASLAGTSLFDEEGLLGSIAEPLERERQKGKKKAVSK